MCVILCSIKFGLLSTTKYYRFCFLQIFSIPFVLVVSYIIKSSCVSVCLLVGVGRYVRFIEKSKKDRNFVLSGKGFYIL